MDLIEIFRSPPGKALKNRVVSETGSSQEKFDQIYTIMVHEPEPVSWKAAWALDYCDENSPGLAASHLHEIIKLLRIKESDGFRRSCLRMLSRYKIPEKDQGILADLCFGWLAIESTPVAVKVHCMQILANIAVEYPELKSEIIMIIEDQMDLNSAGFRSRGKQILKSLKKKI